MRLAFRPYALVPIASNDGRFVDFAPYVPSINDAGLVAFKATLADGHDGVFTSDARSIRAVAVTTSETCPARCFGSHPDINLAGTVCVYATLRTGDDAVLRFRADGRVETLVQDRIGPLGPTMNERGDVALRGSSSSGRAGIRLWRGEVCDEIAETGQRFLGFEGLPVVNGEGRLAFRADLPEGRQGVFVHRDGHCACVAETGRDFEEIARFPILDDRGLVAFAAKRTAGAWGIFSATGDCLIDAGAGFDSLRGILINQTGPTAFYGTPRGGQFGIYTGPDAVLHRLIGLGDRYRDATVVDFALNPVSVNEQGQLAIRVALDDGRQFILRADPRA